METTDHLQGQWAFTVEHFRHPRAASQVGLQVTAAEAATVHIVFDWFDGVGSWNAIVLLLVVFHERGEHLKAVPLGCIGSGVEEAFDFCKGSLIIRFCANGMDVHSDILLN